MDTDSGVLSPSLTSILLVGAAVYVQAAEVIDGFDAIYLERTKRRRDQAMRASMEADQAADALRHIGETARHAQIDHALSEMAPWKIDPRHHQALVSWTEVLVGCMKRLHAAASWFQANGDFVGPHRTAVANATSHVMSLIETARVSGIGAQFDELSEGIKELAKELANMAVTGDGGNGSWS